MEARLKPAATLIKPLWKQVLPSLLVVLLVLALSVCGVSGANPTATATSAENPKLLIQLPEDEGAHDAGIEWWYFNGHLADESAAKYSFHFVTFQSRPSGGVAGQLLQLGWSDHTSGLYLTSEQANLAVAAATPGGFDIQVSGWRMSGDGTEYSLAFDIGGYLLELKAISVKPAVLHEKTGLVSLGPAGATFYYSRTRLDLAGTLTLDGEPRTVNGTAWMDHQWGEFSSQQVGWDWMSLQLDDGSELMATQVWDPAAKHPFAAYGTYVSPDGIVQYLKESDIELKPTGSWTSPATGTVYPMGWEFSVDPLELSLALMPVKQGAEFLPGRYGTPSYWEGAVSVEGTLLSTSVTGKGFVELVGYSR